MQQAPESGMIAAAGTAEAEFAALYDRTYLAVLSYCLRRCRDRADALDAAAEVYVVAWRRLADVPDDEDELRWLYGVGRRVLANQRRGEVRRGRLADRIRSLPHVVDAPDAGISEADHAALVGALERLSESDRELLLLDAWEQLPVRDLAVVFECSESAVKVRLHRARKRLAQEFDHVRRTRPGRRRAAGGDADD